MTMFKKKHKYKVVCCYSNHINERKQRIDFIFIKTPEYMLTSDGLELLSELINLEKNEIL